MVSELGEKMMAVIDKYARDNGFVLILDVGAQQNPVLYASNSIDITSDIVALYDKNAPGAATGARCRLKYRQKTRWQWHFKGGTPETGRCRGITGHPGMIILARPGPLAPDTVIRTFRPETAENAVT